MTATTTAPAKRRGPYRRKSKLTVAQAGWHIGDIYQDDQRRWIIDAITTDGHVTLTSSNTVNYGVRWNTTLDQLKKKPARR